MITTILNWLLMVAILAAFIIWITALVRWDGVKRCKPEDCDSCPYVCNDGPINKNERKD